MFVRLHFLDMAVEYLRRQQDRLKLEFQIGSWPRYDYDHTGKAMGEGAYRAPDDNGALFMVLRNVRRPVADPFGGQHAVISAPRGLPRR